MKKIIILVLSLIWGITSCLAQTYQGKFYIKEKIPNIYIKKIASDGSVSAKQATFLVDSISDNYIYCLEPFVNINNDKVYEAYYDFYAKRLNISDETWKRISLLAYYGYQYQDSKYNHSDISWYYITQILIWRSVDLESRFYFTDSLNGNINENLYQEEINEIENLLAMHEEYPILKIEDNPVILGSTLALEDNNDILENWEISTSNNIEYISNSLIKTLDIGEASIVFTKTGDKYNHNPIIYLSGESQNILLSGNYYPLTYSYKFEVKSVNLKIIKVDSTTQEPIRQAGIKFAITNVSTNETIFKETNSEGIIEGINLGIGKYLISEVKDQVVWGYKINDEVMEIEITEDSSLDIIKYFKNDPLLGSISIHKEGEILISDNNSFQYKTKPLKDIAFGLYDESDILLDVLKTDEFGNLTFRNLPAGKYKIKELTISEEYIPNEQIYEIELLLDKNTNQIIDITKYILNTLPKGNVEIKKIDNLTNDPISNTEFVLFDDNDTIIYQGATDINGLILIKDFFLGKFHLQEINASKGYQKIDCIFDFEINNNADTVILTVKNTKIVDISVPDTNLGIDNTSILFIDPIEKFRKIFFALKLSD